MTTPRTRLGWRAVVAVLLSTATIGALIVVFVALAAGVRPVVIQTGSMGDTAPPGSLVVAVPRDRADITVGDILVMRRPGQPLVTHRIVDIEQNTTSFAFTKGDANASVDPMPYPISDEELVAAWIVPEAGRILESLRSPIVALGLLGIIVLVPTLVALRRIWREPDPHRPNEVDRHPIAVLPRTPRPAAAADGSAAPSPSPPPPPPPPPTTPTSAAASNPARSPAWFARTMVLVVAVSLIVGVSVVVALQSSSTAVGANTFATSACFGAELESVQAGSTAHSIDGRVTEPITPVDPARSFVMASVRSSSTKPSDATVQVRLAADGTAVELSRSTSTGSPPAVTVSWSVIEHSCGVGVQHGVANGSNSTEPTDVPIADVDPGASFVLVSSDPLDGASDYDDDDLVVAELTSPSNLQIRGAKGTTLDGATEFAWQVVTFDSSTPAGVQTAVATLTDGVASTDVALGTPVDPDATLVIASVTGRPAGTDIGDRTIRATLLDDSTVEVRRGVADGTLEVHLQVVAFDDGTTVRRGTSTMATGQTNVVATAEAVDPARSVAISTVQVPMAMAGGMTDETTTAAIGEASATFEVSSPTTVTITRDRADSTASFSWQVIEWGGPPWWDPGYTYRQRIDVATTSAAAPDDYTVPITLDHAALVAAGLSRGDGDDVRIVRWDGATWTELDRVLDTSSAWNRTDTTLWFRTTEPIAAGASLHFWLYVANEGAGPAPDDPESVYLLVEDFESGDLGDFEDRTGGTGWYEADPWTRRIALTVAAGTVGADLTNFPLLVAVTDADLASAAQPDGSDIRFTDALDVPLDHELEAYDRVTGTLVAWVRVPLLPAATATTIHLYYGSSDSPAQAAPRRTWTDDVEAVWHLARDPGGSAPRLDDSSPANHDGVTAGGMGSDDLVVGIVGSALDFDGADDIAQSDSFDLNAHAELTVSGWVRLDAHTEDGRIFSKAIDPYTRTVDLAIEPDGSLRGRLTLDGGGTQVRTGAGAIGTGGWHHASMTWDGVDLTLFVDGVEAARTAASGAIVAAPDMPVTLGNVASLDRPLDGRLDEVRIESVARSAAWLAASEANQRTPSSFVTAGVAEPVTRFDQGTWSYRKPVVTDADVVADDLANFPVLIDIVDGDIAAHAQACGCDVVFTADDGTTRLDHAIEAYDPGTGALTAWVTVPKLSGSEDTELFVYYGNPTATDQQDPAAVFGSNADLQILGAP